MSRTVVAYVDGRPVYRDDGPSKARMVGHGNALPLSEALTFVKVTPRPKPKRLPRQPLDRPKLLEARR